MIIYSKQISSKRRADSTDSFESLWPSVPIGHVIGKFKSHPMFTHIG